MAGQLQPSFSAGELSEALYSRVDLEKYRSGLALSRNWLIDYRGGAVTRPGTQFVAVSDALPPQRPRLIPFVVSSEDAYVLELGHLYMRFIKNGAYLMVGPTPYEVATPYDSADLPLVKFSQSANVLTLTHLDYPPYELRRTGATTFTLSQKSVGPTIPWPASITAEARNATTSDYTYSYVVTAVDDAGVESRQPGPALCAGDILDQNQGKVNIVRWTPVTGARSYRVYKAGPVPSGDAPLPTLYGFIGESPATVFIDNNIGADFSRGPPFASDPFNPGQLTQVTGNGGSGYTNLVEPLIFTGDGTGARGYAVVDPSLGQVVGVVMLAFGEGYTTCVVSDGGPNNAIYTVSIGPQTGTYPATSGYYQQRQMFGGTHNFPNALMGSKPGAYDNFDTNLILQDDDAISVSLASQQLNIIKSMVTMPTGLIVFTSSGGWLVSGGSPEAPLTPTSVSALPQASNGANDMPPIVITSNVLYAQNRGSVVRDLAFNFYVQSYTGTDRSVLASHLFTNYTLEEWTYAEEPYRLVHVVRNDGVMLSLTYVPEQEIFGWTRHDTNGFYRSVCSIPEGGQNTVYLITERDVSGVYRYYIERIVNRNFLSIEDSWCVDCGLALPDNRPNAFLAVANREGTGVNAVSDPAIFAPGDVGKTVWFGDGYATIASYSAPDNVTLNIVKPFPARPNTDNPAPIPFSPGKWSLLTPTTNVSGLDHLDGADVVALADGRPILGLVVSSGSVTLPWPASKVVVGLPYQCDLRTLRLDFGDGAVQGNRKIITGAYLIVYQALGLRAGRDFAHLEVVKELAGGPLPKWVSNIADQNIAGEWNREGQMVLRQDLPLPATVLGIKPRVRIGDTSGN
jgi:hypothetical protein